MHTENEAYIVRTQRSFNRQPAMHALNAELVVKSPGSVEITFPYMAQFTQQNDYMHAGILSTILDSACGYAALSIAPEDADVLTVEFKVNLLRPGVGDTFKAIGQIVKAGKTISVADATLYSSTLGESKPVATMTATIMNVYK